MLVRSNILNYVTGLRIYGRVTNIEVVAINSDDSPKTVWFAGTCHSNLPRCSFSGTVMQHDDPAGTAEFGIVVTGTAKEARNQRTVAAGRIQFQ
jgi:hypothetical protein